MDDGMMWAAVLHGREDVRVERVPMPQVGPGEVRIRVHAALTCGTDLKVYRRGYHARMIVPPAVFGHEFAGVVDAVGEGAGEWKPGDRVTAANSAPCGACFFCLRQQFELCEDLLFVNGSYAEYITLPARLVQVNLLPIPEGTAMEAAALVEPLACVVHGMEDTAVQPGEDVVVLGLGTIGLLFVRLCSMAGARVIAVGRRQERRHLARVLGAADTIAVEEAADPVAAVRRVACGGRGADRVIECVGQPAAWELAIGMARNGGLVNLFGGCPRDTQVHVDTARLHYDEVRLIGTFHHTPQAVRRALALIADGSVPAHSFISGEGALTKLPEILNAMHHGHAGLKTVIYPDAAPQNA
ncbi:MAG: zinc-dependent alcohol dehydrogenase [Chthonomonadales bacterium]